jgi:hypothetical protein
MVDRAANCLRVRLGEGFKGRDVAMTKSRPVRKSPVRLMLIRTGGTDDDPVALGSGSIRGLEWNRLVLGQ